MFKLHDLFVLNHLNVDFEKVKTNRIYEVIGISDEGITKFKDTLSDQIFNIESDEYECFWCFFLPDDIENNNISIIDINSIVKEEAKYVYKKLAEFELNKCLILEAIRSNDKEKIQEALSLVERAKSELNSITNSLMEVYRGN